MSGSNQSWTVTGNPGGVPAPISNLTFALLEDSGFYTVNYTAAAVAEANPPLWFGRGAGCSFVTEVCITTNNLTTNGTSAATTNSSSEQQHQRYWCSQPQAWGCSYDRRGFGQCLTKDYAPRTLPYYFRYFSNNGSSSSVGGLLPEVDYCPMILSSSIIQQYGNATNATSINMCSVSVLDGFGWQSGLSSRCFEVENTKNSSSSNSTSSNGTSGGSDAMFGPVGDVVAPSNGSYSAFVLPVLRCFAARCPPVTSLSTTDNSSSSSSSSSTTSSSPSIYGRRLQFQMGQSNSSGTYVWQDCPLDGSAGIVTPSWIATNSSSNSSANGTIGSGKVKCPPADWICFDTTLWISDDNDANNNTSIAPTSSNTTTESPLFTTTTPSTPTPTEYPTIAPFSATSFMSSSVMTIPCGVCFYNKSNPWGSLMVNCSGWNSSSASGGDKATQPPSTSSITFFYNCTFNCVTCFNSRTLTLNETFWHDKEYVKVESFQPTCGSGYLIQQEMFSKGGESGSCAPSELVSRAVLPSRTCMALDPSSQFSMPVSSSGAYVTIKGVLRACDQWAQVVFYFCNATDCSAGTCILSSWVPPVANASCQSKTKEDEKNTCLSTPLPYSAATTQSCVVIRKNVTGGNTSGNSAPVITPANASVSTWIMPTEKIFVCNVCYVNKSDANASFTLSCNPTSTSMTMKTQCNRNCTSCAKTKSVSVNVVLEERAFSSASNDGGDEFFALRSIRRCGNGTTSKTIFDSPSNCTSSSPAVSNNTSIMIATQFWTPLKFCVPLATGPTSITVSTGTTSSESSSTASTATVTVAYMVANCNMTSGSLQGFLCQDQACTTCYQVGSSTPTGTCIGSSSESSDGSTLLNCTAANQSQYCAVVETIARTAAPTPKPPPPPPPTMVMPTSIKHNQIILVMTDKATNDAKRDPRGVKSLIESTLNNFLGTQSLDMISGTGKPASLVCGTDAVQTTVPNSWVVSLNAYGTGGTYSQYDLASEVTQRLSDAINAQFTKPTQFVDAGILSASGKNSPQFSSATLPPLGVTATSADNETQPVWIVFVGIVVAIAVGTGIGAVLAHVFFGHGDAVAQRDKVMNQPLLKLQADVPLTHSRF